MEYELPIINQAQVMDSQGFTFAKGLRAILRQDPDILLVGEIRDQETAQLAIRASLTGHLVFSTLHTNTAVGAIPRLIDMGVEPYLLSSTLLGVMAQRLVRKICPLCRIRQEPTEEQLRLLRLESESELPRFSTGRGCDSCRQTGFSGRVPVFEYLRVTQELRGMINNSADGEQLSARACAQGMTTLRDDILDKLASGKTALSEAIRVVS